MPVDELIVVTNIALVVVTGAAVWASVREGHRHEERATAGLEELIHYVLQEEHTRDRQALGHDH